MRTSSAEFGRKCWAANRHLEADPTLERVGMQNGLEQQSAEAFYMPLRRILRNGYQMLDKMARGGRFLSTGGVR